MNYKDNLLFLFMKISKFNKGIISTSLGSFWWGIIGVLYFQYFSFVGHFELVIHRCLWTTLMLLFTTFYLFTYYFWVGVCIVAYHANQWQPMAIREQ